jgi:hypothetical protein
MKSADIFMIYDDAQFSKGDFHHRNKIRTSYGWSWLSVPVEKEKKPINEVKIKNDVRIGGMIWSEYHWRQIHNNYANAEFFDNYADVFEKIYITSYYRLIDLNMNLIRFLVSSFSIKTKIAFSSEFEIKSKSSQKVLDLVKAVHGDTYVSGPGGRDYLDVTLFEKEGLKVSFQDFHHPIYKQRFPGFFSNMSAIDILFNLGEKSQNTF